MLVCEGQSEWYCLFVCALFTPGRHELLRAVLCMRKCSAVCSRVKSEHETRRAISPPKSLRGLVGVGSHTVEATAMCSADVRRPRPGASRAIKDPDQPSGELRLCTCDCRCRSLSSHVRDGNDDAGHDEEMSEEWDLELSLALYCNSMMGSEVGRRCTLCEKGEIARGQTGLT